MLFIPTSLGSTKIFMLTGRHDNILRGWGRGPYNNPQIQGRFKYFPPVSTKLRVEEAEGHLEHPQSYVCWMPRWCKKKSGNWKGYVAQYMIHR